MINQKYLVSANPHIKTPMSNVLANMIIIFSLVPSVACSIIFYGLPALLICLTSVVSCYIFDMFFSFIILGKFNFKDTSSIITGLLIALIMPVKISIYFVFLASLIAIIVGKVLFGGQGKELVSGAALANCFLCAIVSGFATTLLSSASTISPFITFATNGYKSIPLLSLFTGTAGGFIGTTCSFAILFGAVILVAFNVYDFYIPVLSVIAFVVTIWISKGGISVIPELFTGSFLFASVFMLPAHSTSPVLMPSKVVYSVMFGILAALCRTNYLLGESGVFFCLILMSIISPLIDMFAGILYRGRRAKKYE